MSDLDVRIIRLDPMRVASVHGFGQSPENQAWKKLEAWAGPRGLFDLKKHRVFGFDNPTQSEASPNYGYEYWMTVGPEAQPEGETEVKEIPGALYAVTRCEVRGDPWASIPSTWQKLVAWTENSKYRMSSRQCLEEHLSSPDNPELKWDMDLYLPIEE